MVSAPGGIAVGVGEVVSAPSSLNVAYVCMHAESLTSGSIRERPCVSPSCCP